ncbi:uncharacterized protein LOC135368475 isoform X2 [Ornithodoros turicata]|uniref:uncharacterized protein LOC135368475 isoform X2 n=1 Tax=Ornithodoros turicata TaxID=34597 RepID=UPI00313958E6
MSDCLQDSLEFCPDSTAGAVPGIKKLVTCLVDALKSTNASFLLLSFAGLMQDLFYIYSPGLQVPKPIEKTVVDFFVNMCPGPLALFCEGVPRNRSEPCKKPIVINFPDTMKLGTCSQEAFVVCPEQRQPQRKHYASFIEILGCVLVNLGQRELQAIVPYAVCQLSDLLTHLIGMWTKKSLLAAAKGTPAESAAVLFVKQNRQLLGQLGSAFQQQRRQLQDMCKEMQQSQTPPTNGVTLPC